MRKLSHRKTSKDPVVSSSPAGDKWHHDIMAYLGGMNSPLSLLAILRLYALLRPSRYLSAKSYAGDAALDVTALIVLGLGNFSQAVVNFTLSRKNDRWIMGKGIDRITILDAVFTVLDWSFALGWLLCEPLQWVEAELSSFRNLRHANGPDIPRRN